MRIATLILLAASAATSPVLAETPSHSSSAKNVYFSGGKQIPEPVAMAKGSGGKAKLNCVHIECPDDFKNSACWVCH